jgi:hypothetical protein
VAIYHETICAVGLTVSPTVLARTDEVIEKGAMQCLLSDQKQ